MTLNLKEKNCVSVLQIGSRHRYAIPRILERASLLDKLFTDSSSWSPLGKAINFTGLAARSPRLSRLSKRVPLEVPKAKVVSTDLPVFLDLMLSKTSTDPLDRLNRTLKIAEAASKVAIRKMTRAPRIVYTLSREFQDYVAWAKTQGSKSIVDVFINPRTAWIMNEHAGPSDPVFTDAYLARERETYLRSISMADVVLCPSEFVAAGVREMFPEAAGRIRIVPYGSSIPSRQVTTEAIPGRFLFVGRDLIRKGADLIFRALPKVREKYPQAEAVFAGVEEADLVASRTAGAGMVALGNLDETRLNQEYARADAFILPSKSEGFASVITEACSFGVPLILSMECGAPVTSGEDAIIVSSSDASALADAMLSILDDRALRNKLAEGSRNLSAIFTEDAWSQRLVGVIDELLRAS
jgi:glycosyltransferase involved in cell wall biosynthesis